MLSTVLAGSNPHMKTLAASTPVLNRENPFSGLSPVEFLAPGTPTIYGINRQSDLFMQTNNQGGIGFGSNGYPSYLRLFGDGVTTQWSAASKLELANAYINWVEEDATDPMNVIPAHETLTDANRLATIIVVNGVLKTRVAGEAAVGASQWSLSKAALTTDPTILTAKNASNAAYGIGTIIEVYMVPLTAIVAQGPLVAGTRREGIAYDFMVATSAAVMTAERV